MDTVLPSKSPGPMVVVFDARGGSPRPNQIVPSGRPAIPPPAPVRGCDRFAGWFVDQGLKLPWDFESPILVDTVLFAKWLPGSCPAGCLNCPFGRLSRPEHRPADGETDSPWQALRD